MLLRSNQTRADTHGRSRAKTPALQGGLADEARFIRAWFDNPLTTGAVSPSGRFLARTMARYVDPLGEGLVIELGPGTGPVTQALIQRGIAPERLVLVEYDAAFCKLLERRFPRATVIQGDAYRLCETLAGKIDAPIAAIVSSLPLLNMPDTQRIGLLSDAFALMDGQGSFVQFTYGLASPMPRKPKGCHAVSFASEVSPPVWLNLPPARVWVYRPATEPARRRPHPAGVLIDKLKARTDRVKIEFLERRERMQTEIRLRKAKVRVELESSSRVRTEYAARALADTPSERKKLRD
ncbi:MAG: hypothetical protein JWL62_1455 [Hyphomicrobiales bacterium]|nr:hypothetical protein [Hyphomicrobiales bacterium]